MLAAWMVSEMAGMKDGQTVDLTIVCWVVRKVARKVVRMDYL